MLIPRLNPFCLSSFTLLLLYCSAWSLDGFGQEKPDSSHKPLKENLLLNIEDMYEREVEDLLNVKVSIASKKQESLFDAPFSASVVTREDIKRAGATSIMEAFRLMPGLVVREQSNGNYDIHLRGGSNVQRNTIFSVSANTTTLVMINNRPIYNYYLGGTFWETIPIDLNDVERIELVRGPSAAMYGPNAVSGVINIITRQPAERGIYAVANAQQGSHDTYINNASVGYKPNKKFSAIFSGNWQGRGRHQDTYYNYPLNDYVSPDDMVFPVPLGQAYPNPQQAMRKYGLNTFINYNPSLKLNFDFSAGMQDSEVQKAYSENFATPLTTARSRSYYTDLIVRMGKLYAQFSYQNGTQEEGLGTLGQKWDFNTIDGVVEYDLKIGGLSLKPGVNYRHAIYDDTPYVDVVLKTGQFNGSREITSLAAYLRGEYALINNRLRLVAALRVDRFNFPDEPYLSVQLASSFKIDSRNLVRFVYARANRSANIIFTYADRFLSNFNGQGVALEVSGNQNLQLLTRNTYELGYRAQFGDNLQLDIEAFYNHTDNYADFLYTNTVTRDIGGVPTTIQPFETQNVPLVTRQQGVTLSLNYAIKRLQFRPFVTIQQIELRNASSFTNTEGALFAPGINNPANNNFRSNIGSKEEHQGTPNIFAGAFLNYQIGRFNININPYFLGSQRFYSFQAGNYPDGRGIADISSKFILNAKIAYAPMSNTSLFVSGRNLLDQREAEFFRSDIIGRTVFGGIQFEF